MSKSEWKKSIHLYAKNRQEAMRIVNGIFLTDYEKNEALSQGAGYPILKHATLNPQYWISDLNVRIEVTLEDTFIIWVDDILKKARRKEFFKRLFNR